MKRLWTSTPAATWRTSPMFSKTEQCLPGEREKKEKGQQWCQAAENISLLKDKQWKHLISTNSETHSLNVFQDEYNPSLVRVNPSRANIMGQLRVMWHLQQFRHQWRWGVRTTPQHDTYVVTKSKLLEVKSNNVLSGKLVPTHVVSLFLVLIAQSKKFCHFLVLRFLLEPLLKNCETMCSSTLICVVNGIKMLRLLAGQCLFGPSATQSGWSFGVMYMSAWRTPHWSRTPLPLKPSNPTQDPLPWPDMLITWWVLHCQVIR